MPHALLLFIYFSMNVQSINFGGASFVLTLMNDQSINLRGARFLELPRTTDQSISEGEGIIFHSLDVHEPERVKNGVGA